MKNVHPAPIILIRGAPGAGKSTFAKEISKLSHSRYGTNVIIHETDDFFCDSLNGKYQWDPDFLSTAHAWNQGELIRHLRDFDETTTLNIVANTFCKIWEMDPYFKIAEKFNRKVIVIALTTQHDNVHNIPEGVVKRMRMSIESPCHCDFINPLPEQIVDAVRSCQFSEQ